MSIRQRLFSTSVNVGSCQQSNSYCSHIFIVSLRLSRLLCMSRMSRHNGIHHNNIHALNYRRKLLLFLWHFVYPTIARNSHLMCIPSYRLWRPAVLRNVLVIFCVWQSIWWNRGLSMVKRMLVQARSNKYSHAHFPLRCKTCTVFVHPGTSLLVVCWCCTVGASDISSMIRWKINSVVVDSIPYSNTFGIMLLTLDRHYNSECILFVFQARYNCPDIIYDVEDLRCCWSLVGYCHATALVLRPTTTNCSSITNWYSTLPAPPTPTQQQPWSFKLFQYSHEYCNTLFEASTASCNNWRWIPLIGGTYCLCWHIIKSIVNRHASEFLEVLGGK